MGGKPIGDRAMTATERSRKFRARHRKRLPWAGDTPFNPEIAAWELEALAPPKTAVTALPVGGAKGGKRR